MGSPTLVLDSPLHAPSPVRSPEPAPQARFYVPALDGLRVLAFLGVWVFHTASPHLGDAGTSWLSAVVNAGMYGVPFFFVLSAFLITRLLMMERARSGKVDLRAYYVRRTLRIWPLYFLVVAVGLAVMAFQGRSLAGASIGLLTFTANRVGRMPESLGPLWSVSVEEQFYLVWPLVLALVPTRRLPYLCGGMVVAALLCRCHDLNHALDWHPMWGSIFSHLDAFAWGALLALNFDRIPRLSRRAWGALSAFGAFGLVAVTHFFPAFAGLRMALTYTAVPLLCAALIGLAIGSKGTFLARPRFAAMGRLTYGLYLWHMLPLVLVRPTTVAGYAGCLLATLGMAAASYYGFERPFMQLKHRFERVQARPA